MHSNFRTFKFRVLFKSIYVATRLFTKFNLFKILHLLQQKFPDLWYNYYRVANY